MASVSLRLRQQHCQFSVSGGFKRTQEELKLAQFDIQPLCVWNINLLGYLQVRGRWERAEHPRNVQEERGVWRLQEL